VRRGLAGQAQIAHDLHVHIVPEQRVGELGEPGRRRLAARLGRGVDQDVEAPEFGDRAGDQLSHRGVLPGLDGHAFDPAPRLGGEIPGGGVEGDGVAGGDHHITAFQGELAGDGAADAPAAAGDQGALAGEVQVHGSLQGEPAIHTRSRPASSQIGWSRAQN
jgi:hypothetical protein